MRVRRFDEVCSKHHLWAIKSVDIGAMQAVYLFTFCFFISVCLFSHFRSFKQSVKVKVCTTPKTDDIFLEQYQILIEKYLFLFLVQSCHWNEGRQLARGYAGLHNCHSRQLGSLPLLLKVILPPLQLPLNPPLFNLAVILSFLPSLTPPFNSLRFPLSFCHLGLHPSLFLFDPETQRSESERGASMRGSRLIW